MTKHRRILVTGGCGFVGRHLVHRLAEDESNEITIVDDLSTGRKMEQWPEHLRCRVTRVEYEDCVRFFQRSGERFDVVFHLAAVVEGRMTIEHNPLKVAKDLSIDAELFRWAIKSNPGKIVYFSSSAVYPIRLQTKEAEVPLSEDMLDLKRGVIDMPDMSYGWSKLTGEFLSHLAVYNYGLKVAVYRPFSGYGEDQAPTYPFPSIIRRVIDSQGVVDVWGSGNQARDFIYIEDVISGILETYEKIDDASALNLGSGIRTSFSELVSKAGEVLGKHCTVRPLTDKPEGVYARYCDRSKQERFGIRLRTPLEDGIRIVAEYLEKGGRE